MRYENVNFQNSQYCLGANQYFDQNTEMCSQATSGLNSCNGDLGAPILVPVDNSGKSNSSNTSSGNPSLNTYALLALTSSSYSLLADPQLSCAKQIQDIKNFLEVTRRKDAVGVRVKKNGKIVKFKVRCSKYLYTLTVADAQKAVKLRQSLPPGLKVQDVGKKNKN
ncbi:60S ribosomal protein L38 [Coemansia thaxteri]|nr:60S ribosomal protein L38 [Coemansia thaxteri]